MKGIIILIVIMLTQALAQGTNPELDQLGIKVKEMSDKCAEKYHITEDQLEQLRMFIVPEEKPLQCYLACVAKKIGLMQSDNTFDKTTILNVLKPVVIHFDDHGLVHYTLKMYEITEICVPLQKGGSDECISAKNAMQCAVENAKKPMAATTILIELGIILKAFSQKCAKEHNITEDQILSIKNFNIPQERAAQCYLACVAKNMGFMKDDNTLNEAKIKLLLKPIVVHLNNSGFSNYTNIFYTIAATCISSQKVDADECITAKNAVECAINNGKQNELWKKLSEI